MRECITHHYACDCREAKFKKLYIAVNKMLARLGADGEVNTLTDEVCELMATLSNLDDGVFDISKQMLIAEDIQSEKISALEQAGTADTGMLKEEIDQFLETTTVSFKTDQPKALYLLRSASAILGENSTSHCAFCGMDADVPPLCRSCYKCYAGV